MRVFFLNFHINCRSKSRYQQADEDPDSTLPRRSHGKVKVKSKVKVKDGKRSRTRSAAGLLPDDHHNSDYEDVSEEGNDNKTTKVLTMYLVIFQYIS